MALFLFRFWPALLPLLVYLIWYFRARRKAGKAGETPPDFRDGPLYWMILATLLIAAACLLLVGFSHDVQKGEYVPPHVENGTLVPGQVKERP